jgi:hypothetical protein
MLHSQTVVRRLPMHCFFLNVIHKINLSDPIKYMRYLMNSSRFINHVSWLTVANASEIILMVETEILGETLVVTNQLTELRAREDFLTSAAMKASDPILTVCLYAYLY